MDDYLKDPEWGLDAKSTIPRDYALALSGLLRVLMRLNSMRQLDDRAVFALAHSTAVSELPAHQFAPNEVNLDSEDMRSKLHTILADLEEAIKETIPWPDKTDS